MTRNTLRLASSRWPPEYANINYQRLLNQSRIFVDKLHRENKNKSLNNLSLCKFVGYDGNSS